MDLSATAAAELGDADPINALALIEPKHRDRILAKLPASHREVMVGMWMRWAHDGQLPPVTDWRTWLIMAGRGFGKTRAGAEWVLARARGMTGGEIALIGANHHDARAVMVEGASGLLAVARPGEIVAWLKGQGRVVFANGTVAQCYSAAAPEGLRGPEIDAAWCDEIGKWGKRGEAAWDNLQMALRAGEGARAIVTTTPRPTPLVHAVKAMAEAEGTMTEGRTRDNPHLPASFIAAMTARYAGTRLGRQELDGELLGEAEGALMSEAVLAAARRGGESADGEAPALTRVVVGIDPPATATGDACGIVAAGIDAEGTAHVLEDASVKGASPDGWAQAAADCAGRWGATLMVAEANQGGDMVKAVLDHAGVPTRVKLVRASVGKVRRAEPVATLYERGRVKHRTAFPWLEAELGGLQAAGGYDGPGRSPDRADALVWALTELTRRGGDGPRVRWV